MTNVAVLLPAYNEEVAIASMVLLSSNYADEVIVIDDGSTDRTKEVSELAGATVLSHKTNKGKGVAEFLEIELIFYSEVSSIFNYFRKIFIFAV